MELRLSDYASPVTTSFGKEVDEAIHVCFYCIDNPPEEYRVVRQAIQGLAHLGKYRPTLRPVVVLKLLQVINSPQVYRSHPRRFAVRDMGHLAVSDETLVVPCADLLIQMVEKKNENSQYVRKAAFCALSRIGRKFPTLHEKLVPLFISHYRDPNVKTGEKWGILIGLGRMAQTSAALRREVCALWFEAAESPIFRLRWAAIKGMCHACCPAGDVERDVEFEEKCFELGVEMYNQTLPDPAGGNGGGGENRTKKHYQKKEERDREEAHLVQYGIMQGFGLLLRASINTWWPRLSSIFAEALVDPQVASIVKASVILNLGKASYYMKESDPYFATIRDILWELSGYENIVVSEPASYALANMALGHSNMYHQVKTLLLQKFQPARCLSEASEHTLRYYLKTWCKFISYSYVPVLSDCSSVVCSSTRERISREELESIQNSVRSTPPPNRTRAKPPRKRDFLSPQFRKQINPDSLASAEVQSDSEDDEEEEVKPSSRSQTVDRSAIARDAGELEKLCIRYSPSVLESILFILEDPNLLDDAGFLANLASLISVYIRRGRIYSMDDKNDFQKHFSRVVELNMVLKENVVEILLHPESMDNPLWASNLKRVAQQSTSLPVPQISAPPPSFVKEEDQKAIKTETPSEDKKEAASPAGSSLPSSTSSTHTESQGSSNSTTVAPTNTPGQRKDFVPVKAPPPEESQTPPSKQGKEPIKNVRKRERDMDDDEDVDEQHPDKKSQKRTKEESIGQTRPSVTMNSPQKAHSKDHKNTAEKSQRPSQDNKRSKDKGRDRPKSGKSQSKEEKKKKTACAFYLAGRCNKGDRCAFLHSKDQLASATLCRFFKEGDCRNGNSCRFSHDFKTEMCPRGKRCNLRECSYSHDEEEVVQAGLRGRQGKSDRTTGGPRPEERRPVDHRRLDDRRQGGIPPRTGDRPPPRRNLPPTEWGPRSGPSNRSPPHYPNRSPPPYQGPPQGIYPPRSPPRLSYHQPPPHLSHVPYSSSHYQPPLPQEHMTYDPAVNYYEGGSSVPNYSSQGHQPYDPAGPANQLPFFQAQYNQPRNQNWGPPVASAPYYPAERESHVPPPSYPPTSSRNPPHSNYSHPPYHPR